MSFNIKMTNAPSYILAQDTPIFRIDDFFSIATLISTRKLRFACATNFSDDNEGIDRLLAGYQATTGPCAGALIGIKDRFRVESIHEKIKESYFISCWTRTPESIAMWSLYSNDNIGIRLQTCTGKLQMALNNFQAANGVENLLHGNGEALALIATKNILSCVRYEDLHHLYKKIARRGKAWRKLRERGVLPAIDFGRPQSEREKHRIATEHNFEPFTLKDESYRHEDEVRAVIRLADAQAYDELQRWREMYRLNDGNTKYIPDAVAQDLNSLQEERGTIKLQDIYIDVPFDFFTGVTIDPRCPLHKQVFMKNWFEMQGIKVSISHCFGRFTDLVDLSYPYST
jgi:hypothetical protein